MLGYFLAQIMFTFFLCFDIPSTWEQGENVFLGDPFTIRVT